MAVLSDFERVFEFGPVFRAEDSNTNRHLCEFTSFDIEMKIHNSYFEVVDFLINMFTKMFKKLETDCKDLLDAVHEQYPFEPIKISNPVPKLSFEEAVELLKQSGVEQSLDKDLSTEVEKELGKIVKEKYNSDFYVVYNYPKSCRPFYTMTNPKNSSMTNSYDFFLRGEEILSGSQRINN